ncbi:MAG: SUMF1/EgtB/PvdO family nonheme iron enzyme [Candidatus Competibacteraceae bacterium]
MPNVFLSSTARDLTAYRNAVTDAVNRLDGFHCVRMEDFGARDSLADDFCRAKILECDVAVFIIGLCYGSSPKGAKESYTHREYLAAKKAGKPILVFLSAEGEFYKGYDREPDRLWKKQQAFRKLLNEEHIRAEFITPDELATKVTAALGNWARDTPENQPISGMTSAERHLRDAYLNRVMERCGFLSLASIDPAAAQGDTDTRLNLNFVYTALLTRSPRQEEIGGIEDPRRLTRDEKLRSALEELDRNQRLVLQGDPGSGKSTFVNFVALCLAGEILGDERANLSRLAAPLPAEDGSDGKESQSWKHGALLPVPVVLRDFAATGLPERGEAKAGHLWDFIEKELKDAVSTADYADFLKKELLERGGLLLLDGLDEVPEAERRREQVKQAVEDFARNFGKCRMLVTSRTYAYQNQGWRLQGFAEAVLASFSDGQIRRFIARWYEMTAGLERMSAQDATGRAESLKRAIFSRPMLYELAQRPLLLTLMASLHAWRRGDLPEKRELLYHDTVDLLLNRWERRFIKEDTEGRPRSSQPSIAEYLKADKTKIRTVLEDLAFEAHRAQPELTGTADLSEDILAGRLLRLSGNPDANIGRLVEYLRDRAGLLYPRGVGVYTFPHRSFQEYLAACHLTDDEYPDKIAELARTDPDRWREVALLAGAKAARGAAASLWLLADALCFREADDPKVEPADDWGAQIAGQALVETADLSKVSPANQTKLTRIRQWLVRLLRSERLPATERALAGNNLAVLGDPRFNPERWYLPDEPLLGFIEIPAGEFTMGSEEEGAWGGERLQHQVSLPSYYLARWPVTVAQFTAFVKAGGFKPGDQDALKGAANHPVVWVTWHDAIEYCRWLNKQLWQLAPTYLAGEQPLSEAERAFWQGLADGSLRVGLASEAEWEKAARGTDGRIYPWGKGPDPERANYSDIGLNSTSTVGCFPGGTSPYGVEEMSGNVWEWTRSLWGKEWEKPDFVYPYEPTDGREKLNAPDEVHRVLRGGSFGVSFFSVIRCAARDHYGPGGRYDYVGFRVVVSPFVFSGL